MDLPYRLKMWILTSQMKKKRKIGLDIEAAERHQLPENAGPILNNSYYFGANSTDGQSLIFRLAFRETFSELFILYTNNGRFLYMEDSAIANDSVPMKLECLEPGKKWHITYDGQLKDSVSGAMVPFSFEVDYVARLPIFSSAHHGCVHGLLAAIARQKWDKEFFAKATGGDMGVRGKKQKAEQVHYEQTGRMSGTVTVDGVSECIDLPSSRDHSYGPRNWGFMNDHIWLMAQTDAGEALNLQLVNYPFAQSIYLGYTDIENGGKNASLIQFRNLSYEHCGGMGTDTIELDMEFDNGRTYHVKAVRDVNIPTPYDNGNYYFQETIGNFEIDGVKARGTIEYGFNRDTSRWDSYRN